ncbi:MAG: energy transducer TonB [Gammaproteobacteria bacterium]|nr:energy transducer TonB [Gammaproteobacteria bacterium]
MSNSKPLLLAIIASAELEESIRTIAGEAYELVYAKDIHSGIDTLKRSDAKVALLDFDIATSDPEALDLLRDEKTDLVPIVICPREQSDELLATNINREAFRVLFSPLATGQTKLALAAAFKHSVEQHLIVRPASTTTAIKKAKPSVIKPVHILASLAVFAVALVSWVFISKHNTAKQEAARAEAELQQQEAKAQRKLNQLLLFAEGAKNAGNYFPPAPNNALQSYLAILNDNPGNPVAEKALDDLSVLALGDYDLHFSNGSSIEALNSLEQAREIAKLDPGLATRIGAVIIDKQNQAIESIRTALNQQRVSDAANSLATYSALFDSSSDEIGNLKANIDAQQENLDRESELNETLANIQDAITNNRLLTPSQNNARFYINRLENLDATNPDIEQLKSDLADRLLVQSRQSTNDENFTAARRYIDAADALGANTQIVNTARTQLIAAEDAYNSALAASTAEAEAEAQEQEQADQQAEAERLEAERIQQEAADAAAEAQRIAEEREALRILLATPVSVTLSQLTPVTRPPPVYPRRYEKRGTTGSATVAFTVKKDGSTSNISVKVTEPSSAVAFGRAASNAIEKWTFEPFTDEENRVRLATTEIKINFQQ